MLNPHLFLEALRVNGELQNGALSLSRSQFNLLKIVIFGNMTIWIWQLFWKFSKYDNLQYDNYFEHMKIWQFPIWQLFWKNCHIWISKYDKKKKPMGVPDQNAKKYFFDNRRIWEFFFWLSDCWLTDSLIDKLDGWLIYLRHWIPLTDDSNSEY